MMHEPETRDPDIIQKSGARNQIARSRSPAVGIRIHKVRSQESRSREPGKRIQKSEAWNQEARSPRSKE
jgi:hypothetical protein